MSNAVARTPARRHSNTILRRRFGIQRHRTLVDDSDVGETRGVRRRGNVSSLVSGAFSSQTGESSGDPRDPSPPRFVSLHPPRSETADMSTLEEKFEEANRDAIVQDVVDLIDEEVHSKSGLTGMALKGGYKAVRRLKDGIIEEAADALLDDFTQALAPMYEDYLDSHESTFEAYLDSHRSEACEALLSITDEKAEEADNQSLRKIYNKLRGQAERQVKEALPGVGAIVDKHAPA